MMIPLGDQNLTVHNDGYIGLEFVSHNRNIDRQQMASVPLIVSLEV